MFHIAFYMFAPVPNPEETLEQVKTACGDLLGNVLVAHEGLNGMLAGSAEELDAFEAAVQSPATNEGRFQGMVFKRTECVEPPFKKFKIKVKKEVVPLGVEGFDPAQRVDDIKAADVQPREWRELIARDDVILIDNRNSFEFQVGRFQGAIDPGISEFRDFTRYVNDNLDEWKDSGKTIAMYCTGGIRCEKSSAWMQDLGLEVRQLEGGILNYFQVMEDAEKDWDGECFVFDDRVTVDTKCQESGKTLRDIPDQFPLEIQERIGLRVAAVKDAAAEKAGEAQKDA